MVTGLVRRKQSRVLVSVRPRWPRTYKFGFLTLGAALIISEYAPRAAFGVLLASLFLLSSYVVWTPAFWNFMFLRGLRKAGYKGGVQSITVEDALEVVLA